MLAELATLLANEDSSKAENLSDIQDSVKATGTPENSIFLSNVRYNSTKFEGIIPDTGTAGCSTGGKPQLEALQKLFPIIKLDESRAGEHSVLFEKGSTVKSLGAIHVPTPFGNITLQILPTNTPFLHASMTWTEWALSYAISTML